MIRSARLSAAIVAAASGLALVAGSASAQVFSASPGLRIPATGTGGPGTAAVTSTINVPFFAQINDINIIVDITHTFDADLDIFLVAPDFTSYLKLTSDNGGGGQNFTFTRFDDVATDSITTGAAPFNNNFRPEGGAFDAADPWLNTSVVDLPASARPNLTSFDGFPTNGLWTLVIGDDAGGDFGTLNYWSIEFNRNFDPLGPTPLDIPTDPQVTLTLTPTSGRVGVGSYNAFATVTPGTNPPSANILVRLNATQTDGGNVTLRDNGVAPDVAANDNIHSGSVNVGPAAVIGPQTVFASALDDRGRFGGGSAAFTVLPTNAQWDETTNGGGDAGDLRSTAQVPEGTGPLLSFTGDIAISGDADLYLINICDRAYFSATTVNPETGGDTQLFLFNSAGFGITSNDDSQSIARSTITNQFLLENNNFYLGVSRYNLDPIDDAGRFIWNNTPFDTERRPDGPGQQGTLGGWVGPNAGTGSYRVDLTGTCFAAEPGPSCDYDFNQDENVDLLDAQQMAQVFVGLITPQAGWLDGDLNGDENADLTDAQLLAAYVVSGNCGV